MKTSIKSRGFAAILALTFAVVAATGGTAFADYHHDGYRHDAHGYWDNHHAYHHYAYYHQHRGYWGYQNGVRIFINL
jgi:hypothetical protein